MDAVAIQSKLQQINSLLAEVTEAMEVRTNDTGSDNNTKPVQVFPEKAGLISVPLFDGFDVRNDTHACYLLLCHKAGSGLSQNDVVKQYLTEAKQPADRSALDRLRKSVDYLCKSKQLTRPWRENARESGSE